VSCACENPGIWNSTTVGSHIFFFTWGLVVAAVPHHGWRARDWACKTVGWIGDAHVRKVSIEVAGHSERVLGLGERWGVGRWGGSG
jgi:hypothetical protein